MFQRADPKKPHLYLEPRPHSRVCSIHFVDGRPTNNHPFPELELGHNKTVRAPPKRSRYRTSSPIEHNEETVSHVTPENSEVNDNDQSPVTQKIYALCFFFLMLAANLFSQLQDSRAKLAATQQSLEKIRKENRILRCKLKLISGKMKSKSFFSKYVLSDKEAKFFTGIPSVKLFHAMYEICRKHVSRRWQGYKRFNVSKFSVQRSTKLLGVDEFFLTLMRIRLGLVNHFVAKFFNISDGLASQIFATWLSSLDVVVSKLVYWPSKLSVKVTSPIRYASVPGLRAIIDCSEIFLETPKDPKLQSSTWSDYKHHNTAKFLIAVAPNSMITFVSNLYNGRCSDKNITLNSKFLDKLDAYDVIQADKGFNIQADCDARLVTLHIPPGKRGMAQMPIALVNKTKRVANLRILVEQVIRRLKTFRMLKYELPITMIPHGDKIVRVCSGICNMYEPVYKK